MNKQKHLKTSSKTLNRSKNSTSESEHVGARCALVTKIVVAFLVGAVVVFALALQSLKTVLLGNSISAAHGKAYFTTSCNASSCEKSIEDVRIRHHGELVGETKLYQDTAIGGGYLIIGLDTVADFLIADPQEIPKDKVPVLVSDAIAEPMIPDQFFAVGSYNNIFNDQLREFNAGIFAPVFKELYSGQSTIFLIDDSSDKIQNFLSKQHLANAEHAALDSDNIEDFLEYERPVVAFSNSHDALSYQKEVSQIEHAYAAELFSNVVNIDYAFTRAYVLLSIALVILLVLVIEVIIVIKAIITSCLNKNR